MINYQKIIIISLILLFLPIFSLNADVGEAKTNLDYVAGLIGFNTGSEESSDLAVIVGKIISVALGTLGIIFMILTLYGGWLWMTAAGNEERLKKAKDLIRDSIIGLIIIIAAYALAIFVVEAISFSITSETPPS